MEARESFQLSNNIDFWLNSLRISPAATFAHLLTLASKLINFKPDFAPGYKLLMEKSFAWNNHCCFEEAASNDEEMEYFDREMLQSILSLAEV